MSIISLGAGVQSSTLALMAAHGEIEPLPKFAVFADTGDESEETYFWLNRLESLLPFPIIKVASRYGRLSQSLTKWGHSQIPAFFPSEGLRLSKGKRQCTKHWKIVPVQNGIRHTLDLVRKRLPESHITVWQGISLDEVSRMKTSREKWIKSRWPLLEKGMRRRDCLAWMKLHGYPEPARSACVFCPLQNREEWRQKKIKGGVEWALILEVEKQLLERGEYLDPEGKGVSEFADGKFDERQINLFENECEGMCGV